MNKQARYIPSVLRNLPEKRPREVRFGVGTRHNPTEIGMHAGPFKTERDALETVGLSKKDVIVRFNADMTDSIIWKWDGGAWVSFREKKTK